MESGLSILAATAPRGVHRTGLASAATTARFVGAASLGAQINTGTSARICAGSFHVVRWPSVSTATCRDSMPLASTAPTARAIASRMRPAPGYVRTRSSSSRTAEAVPPCKAASAVTSQSRSSGDALPIASRAIALS